MLPGGKGPGLVPLVQELTEVNTALHDLRELAVDLYAPTDPVRREVAIELNSFADSLAELSDQGLEALELRLAPSDVEGSEERSDDEWAERTSALARDLVEVGDRVLSLTVEEERFVPGAPVFSERIRTLGQRLVDLGSKVEGLGGVHRPQLGPEVRAEEELLTPERWRAPEPDYASERR